MSDAVLKCSGLAKTYQDGSLEVAVLRGVELALAPGEKVAIVGAGPAGLACADILVRNERTFLLNFSRLDKSRINFSRISDARKN